MDGMVFVLCERFKDYLGVIFKNMDCVEYVQMYFNCFGKFFVVYVVSNDLLFCSDDES